MRGGHAPPLMLRMASMVVDLSSSVDIGKGGNTCADTDSNNGGCNSAETELAVDVRRWEVRLPAASAFAAGCLLPRFIHAFDTWWPHARVLARVDPLGARVATATNGPTESCGFIVIHALAPYKEGVPASAPAISCTHIGGCVREWDARFANEPRHIPG